MTRAQMNANSSILQGAKLRFAGNLFQKLISLTLNQILVRYSSPEVYGVASIQLELLLSTVLFLSREGIRITALRLNIERFHNSFKPIINLSWIPSFIVVVFVIIIYHKDSRNQPTCSTERNCVNEKFFIPYVSTHLLYCLGALFESFAEPWYNIYQYQMLYTPRMTAESIALLIRSIITVLTVVVLDMNVIGYGFAQLSYGIFYFLIMISYTSRIKLSENKYATITDMLFQYIPSSVSSTTSSKTYSNNSNNDTGSNTKSNHNANKSYTNIQSTSTTFYIIFSSYINHIIPLECIYTAITITSTSLLKHILTEADKIILSFFYTSIQQGIFAFAHNYGSLVARMIYLPLEESSRLIYAKSINNLNTNILQYQNDDGVNTIISQEIQAFHHQQQQQPQHNDKVEHIQQDIILTLCTRNLLTHEIIIKYKSDFYQNIHDIYHIINLLRYLMIFGILISIFGPPYVRLGVQLLFKKWYSEEVVYTLSYYCIYLFFLGMNGLLEACVHTICHTSDYYLINISYVASTLMYILSVYICHTYLHMGTSGLVISNCVSMFIRIIICISYLHVFFVQPSRMLRINAMTNRKDSQTESESSNANLVKHQNTCKEEMNSSPNNRNTPLNINKDGDITLSIQTIKSKILSLILNDYMKTKTSSLLVYTPFYICLPTLMEYILYSISVVTLQLSSYRYYSSTQTIVDKCQHICIGIVVLIVIGIYMVIIYLPLKYKQKLHLT